MPDPDQDLLGLPRARWVKAVASALVASSTPSGRFRMMRGGFIHFHSLVRPIVKQVTGLALTSQDARSIYEYLARYVWLNERHLQRVFEAQYELSRRKDLERPEEFDLSRPTFELTKPEDIVVHHVHDGALKRVQ